ncbi:MAG: hypothetical protein ACRYFU_00960 [Janthinobacterium lividum]
MMTKTKTRSNADLDGAPWFGASSVLQADGLLGYEDEADDVASNRSRQEGDAVRAEEAARVYGRLEGNELPGPSRGDADTDQDAGDLGSGVDEDALDEDELDTDRVTSTEAMTAAIRVEAMRHVAEQNKGQSRP